MGGCCEALSGRALEEMPSVLSSRASVPTHPPPYAMPAGSMQACFQCEGKGFCHTSEMDHDAGPNERCFFCKDCDGCGGSGAIPGGQPSFAQKGVPGMGMVQRGGGMQACFKCEGKGFCHTSTMDHDAGPDERCFFCKDCDGCGGSGAIPGGQPSFTQMGVPGMGVMPGMGQGSRGAMQACFMCEGKGFCHTSEMDHDADPHERCIFCKDCDGCGGRGAIQGGPQTGMVPGMGMMVQGAGGGMQACFKCEGKGFCHTSSMDHDASPHERCFFCKDCDGCGGSGAILGGQPSSTQTGVPGMGMGMMGQGGGGGMQACFKCEGKGFCHTSSMDHDKGPDERCFFCKDCDGCGGSGAIPGGQPGLTQMGVPGMGMGMMGQGGGVGMQACFKCEGKGFCHTSSMDHDKGPDERCFFCQDCDGCGGSGAIPSGGRSMCFKCEGKGFCHTSSMDHDKGPDERCFFCKDCDGCGGTGALG